MIDYYLGDQIRARQAFERSLAEASVEDVARKVWPAFFAAK